MKLETHEFAGLKIRVARRAAAAPPRHLVVLLHGYGAPGTDLVPLARELGVDLIAFPEAPIDLSEFAPWTALRGTERPPRAWWHIDIARMQRAAASGAVTELVTEVPAGLREAGAQLGLALSELEAAYGISDERTIVGGFSQGAMLATDLALSYGRKFGGLVILSGSMVASEQWRSHLPQRTWPVFMSHGRFDSVLPFSIAEGLAHELGQSVSDQPRPAKVTWLPFEGDHGIPRVVLQRLAEFLASASVGLSASDAEEARHTLGQIVDEEQSCLRRVLDHWRERRSQRSRRRGVNYDHQLIELRDQIATSRLEDIPPMLEQMERLQGLATRQLQMIAGVINPRSPYFGRLVLQEGERTREVLIGRSTYLDASSGIRIVDWRDAPVSRLYYRYNEGDSYEETFGDREIEGRVQTRRSLTIVDSELRRIVCPQGTFLRPENGDWRQSSVQVELKGGQGAALRAEEHHRPRKLGIGVEGEDDKHLKEITALIDARQFDLITRSESGWVVIQGGAGSGKTTIGLHRLAYLTYRDPRRFRADRILVVVFNQALARYVSKVLPALDVTGIQVRTYEDWAERLRRSTFPDFRKGYSSETPPVVTRVKKHPMMLHAIDRYVDDLKAEFTARFDNVAGPELRAVLSSWREGADAPLAHRIHRLKKSLTELETAVSVGARHGLERECDVALERIDHVIGAWADLLTDKQLLLDAAQAYPEDLSERDIQRHYEWCVVRCGQLLAQLERDTEDGPRSDKGRKADPHAKDDSVESNQTEELVELDREDDALLLRFHQRLKGPLLRPQTKDALIYEHVMVDEAQDLSPVELAVVVGTVSKGQSITLAGDEAQRMLMNNGFAGFNDALRELGHSHIEIEPLKLSYRSTKQIIDLARDVLGPLAPTEAPTATRSGVPVQLFRFADTGDAVAFLAEALRGLMREEPRASVAVVARFPEQADLYHIGLHKAETPHLRRIADQDFPFKPGIDVTDVRQVKGLEFDYVVLVEVSQSTYGTDDEARHLLHIGATRAAHQLWLLATGHPSLALPAALRDRSY